MVFVSISLDSIQSSELQNWERELKAILRFYFDDLSLF